MTLTKTAVNVHNTSRVSFVKPENVEKIRMGISQRAMKFITDRLTDLYPKPIEALVREIISNASDATKALPVDQRRPIEVTSPSIFNNSFVVRDYGIGMSPDTVREIYTQYGESTKPNDMDAIGAYGLGAKAPLAYCDDFMVSTTFDGVTTNLVCGRDEDGNFGEIQSIEHTGAESGTVITIPLRSGHDVAEFTAALEHYKKNPLDIDIIMDGKKCNGVENFYALGTVVLDVESNLEGNVWLAREKFVNYATKVFFQYNNDLPSVCYVLSGWGYVEQNRHNYYHEEPMIYVEIKPGVVDFASSRDEITKNERFRNLHQRVIDKFGQGKDAQVVQNRLLEIYREKLNEDEAIRFCQKVTYPVPSFNDEGKIVTNGMTFSMSDFAIANGFNPVEEWGKERNKNLYGIASVYDGHYSVVTTYEYQKGSKFHIVNYSHGRIQDGIHKMQELFEGGAEFSLAQMIVANAFGRSVHSNSLSKIHVVENATQEAIDMLRKKRSRVVSYTDMNNIAFLDSKLDKESKEIIEKLGTTITTQESDEFIEELKNLKAQKGNSVASTDSGSHPFAKLTDSGKKIQEIAEMDSLPKNTDIEQLTINDVIAKGAFVVIGERENDFKNILRGALNAGVKFDSSPVYYVTHANGFLASEYRALANHGKVAISKGFRPSRSSAAFDSVHNANSYFAEILAKDLEKISIEQAKQALSFYVNGFGYVVNEFAALKPYFTNETLIEIANLAEHRSSTNGRALTDNPAYGLGQETLTEIVGTEFFEDFSRVTNVFRNISNSWGPLANAYSVIAARETTDVVMDLKKAIAPILATEIESRYAKEVAEATKGKSAEVA